MHDIKAFAPLAYRIFSILPFLVEMEYVRVWGIVYVHVSETNGYVSIEPYFVHFTHAHGQSYSAMAEMIAIEEQEIERKREKESE